MVDCVRLDGVRNVIVTDMKKILGRARLVVKVAPYANGEPHVESKRRDFLVEKSCRVFDCCAARIDAVTE